jgi:hypothetical protein
MAPRLPTDWRKLILGFAIILSAFLGGGAASGLWSDGVLQIILVLAALSVLSRSGEPIPAPLLAFALAIPLVVALQLVPLPTTLTQLVRSDEYAAGRELAGGLDVISLNVGRTVEVFIYAAVLAMLFLAFLRLPGASLHGLVPFVLIAIFCNGGAALIQYAGADGVRIDTALPYTITAGFFANRNHLVAVLYAAIPFLLYFSTFPKMRLWTLIAVVLVLLVLLAAGSRAGAILGFAALLCSVGFFVLQSRVGLGTLLVLTVAAGIYALGTWFLLEARDLDPEFGRTEFAMSTLQGIKSNWLFGVGFGSFPLTYQLFEDPSMVFRSYVNHAHNDYLELLFEGGLPAALLLLVYLVAIVTQLLRVRHSHFQKAAFLSILFVLIHSFVDYPLRTLAVAVPFVFFHAILFHPGLRPQNRFIKGIVDVEEDGRRRRLPIEAPDGRF